MNTTAEAIHGISRRTLIGATPAVAAAALITGLETAQADPGRQILAFVTDTHIDPENQLHSDRLAATFSAIEADNPLLVLHGGDVTEYGNEGNLQEYLSLIPASLSDKVIHTPGNHETRWDPSATEVYDRFLGQRNFSVTVAGIQIISMDPSMPQQELAYYTREDLDWLDRELRRKRGNQPTILMAHYPQGEGHYYTVNQEDFLKTIEGKGVQLMLTGHIHQLATHHFNGLTNVHIGASRAQAQYLRLIVDNDAQALTLEHVAIPDHTAWQDQVVTQLGTVPLVFSRGTDPLKPRDVEVTATRTTLSASLVLPRATGETTIKAAVYDQDNYGRVTADVWHPFTRTRGNTWRVDIDVSPLAPGEHRLRVNVEEGPRRWREIIHVTIPGTTFLPTDETTLSGLIHGGLASLGSRVFVPSAIEGVTAFDVQRGRLSKAWTAADVGPVWTSLAIDPDLGLVIAGSSDHHLRAVHADSGSVAWATDLGQPVMSEPLVTSVAGVSRVVVVADQQLSLIDTATGAVQWTREVADMSAGRAAADDERIYVGLGDGKAWAFSASDGAELWSVELSGREDTYRKRIYGPWNNHVKLVGDDLVIFSTVTAATAMNRATGETVWMLPQSYLYTPIGELADGDLVMVDEWGNVRRVDPATGAVRWHAPTAVPRALEAAPVIVDERIYLVGVTGMLGVVDASTGQLLDQRQLMANNVFSSPVAVNGSLVVGHMPGRVRVYPLGG